MKTYDFAGIAATATFLCISVTATQAVTLEQTPSTVTGNPVEDRIVIPSSPASPSITRQEARPPVQPIKDQIALQTEIESLKAIASRTVAASSPRSNAAANNQKRQSANAAWVLGLIYANGLGVDVDVSEAHIRFKQAYDLGEPLASAGLAWCEIQGCETLPSANKARSWVAQLRAAKPGRALYLDWLIEDTFLPLLNDTSANSAVIEKARTQRRQLLLNAAKLQDPQALIELGFEAVAQERLKDAQAYFQAAAPTSTFAAKNTMIIVSRQIEQKPLCQIPSNTELSDTAILKTAQALHKGDACAVNYVDAIRLYNVAARKGNLSAQRMLSLIYSKPATTAIGGGAAGAGAAGGNINIAWMQQLANLDVGNLSINLNTANLSSALQKEPTPLYDLIPLSLRNLVKPK
jgi:uncharacterized protein